MEAQRPSLTPMDVKEYLTNNKIPQLFECLMTGLMYHRPKDYLTYMQECLLKIKRDGLAGVRWDLFVGPKSEVSSLPAFTKEEAMLTRYLPQPGIDSIKAHLQPNVSIICILGGPGLDISSYSTKLINHYPSFVHLSMGDLLRNRVKLEINHKASKWPNAVRQVNSGELLPQEMVMESLIWNLNLYPNATGFIIDGFPRTVQQYEEFKQQVGLDSIACVLLIDASEETCKQRLVDRGQQDEFWKDHEKSAIDTRICLFKLQTLPVCKFADADGKLRVVDGEIKLDHVLRELRTVCEYVLSGKVTGPATRPTPGAILDKPTEKVSHGMIGCPGQTPVFDIPRIVPTVADQGRVADLHTCPIILLFGGPGSGRTDQATALCHRLPGLKLFNVTDFLRSRVLDQLDESDQKDWDVIARRVHSSDPPMDKDRLIPEYWDVQVDILRQEFNKVAEQTRAVVIEGYPNDDRQLSAFNEHIGGVDLAILLDCEEDTLQRRLIDRYSKLSRTEDEEIVTLHRILFFKHCTLPVVRHYDERSLLVTVPADREPELVLNDVVTVVEYFLGKQQFQGNNSAVSTASERSHSIGGDSMGHRQSSSLEPITRKNMNGPEITAIHTENIQAAHRMSKDGSSKDDNQGSQQPSKTKVIFITGSPVLFNTTHCERIATYFDYNLCVANGSDSLMNIIENVLSKNGERPMGLILTGFEPTQQEKRRIVAKHRTSCVEIRLRGGENGTVDQEIVAQEEESKTNVPTIGDPDSSTSSAAVDVNKCLEFIVDVSRSSDEIFEKVRLIMEEL